MSLQKARLESAKLMAQTLNRLPGDKGTEGETNSNSTELKEKVSSRAYRVPAMLMCSAGFYGSDPGLARDHKLYPPCFQD